MDFACFSLDNGREHLSQLTTLTFAFLGAACSHRNVCRRLYPNVNNGGGFVCVDQHFVHFNKFMEIKQREITDKCSSWY